MSKSYKAALVGTLLFTFLAIAPHDGFAIVPPPTTSTFDYSVPGRVTDTTGSSYPIYLYDDSTGDIGAAIDSGSVDQASVPVPISQTFSSAAPSFERVWAKLTLGGELSDEELAWLAFALAALSPTPPTSQKPYYLAPSPWTPSSGVEILPDSKPLVTPVVSTHL